MRAHIGYVPQKAYLFTGTIDMNVRYGAASGQVLSVEDVENACHLAKADEFINRLDGGYQYTVLKVVPIYLVVNGNALPWLEP